MMQQTHLTERQTASHMGLQVTGQVVVGVISVLVVAALETTLAVLIATLLPLLIVGTVREVVLHQTTVLVARRIRAPVLAALVQTHKWVGL